MKCANKYLFFGVLFFMTCFLGWFTRQIESFKDQTTIVSTMNATSGFYSMLFFNLNHYLYCKRNQINFQLNTSNWLFKSHQFSDLAITERPMHCINPVLNRPKTFFIKDDANEWKEESQGDFVYQMKCIEEWQNEEEKMLLTQFFERINDKMWDTWKEVCETNPRYKNIYERMHRVSNSDDKMSVLDDLGSTLAMET